MKRKILLFSLVVMLVMSLVAMGCPAPAPPAPAPPAPAPPVAPTPKPPAPAPPAPAPVKEVVLTSYGIGTQAYSFSVGIAEAVKKVSGITSRVIPAGGDMGRMMLLRAGEVDLAIATGGTGWFVTHGAADFAALEWGPQPLRMAWRGGNLYHGFYTRGDSGIKELSDLKGKRVAQIAGSPTINNLIKAGLAFGGLSLDDCKVIVFPSHGEGGKALSEGAIDFYQFGTTGGRPIETAASPHGIHWFELDPNDDEAWERFWAYAPWTAKALIMRAAGYPEHPKFNSEAYPYNIWAWDKTPVNVVYSYASAMWDGYDLYKDMHAELPHWNHEILVDSTGCYYPYHEGLIKLLKEKGVWTPELEKFQQEQISNEAKRMKLWEEALGEAEAKKIKIGSDEWKDFWWNKLLEAGLLM